MSRLPTGIAPADAARFDAFVSDYQAHGNGTIVISAPAGMRSPTPTIDLLRRAHQRHGRQPRSDPGRHP